MLVVTILFSIIIFSMNVRHLEEAPQDPVTGHVISIRVKNIRIRSWQVSPIQQLPLQKFAGYVRYQVYQGQ